MLLLTRYFALSANQFVHNHNKITANLYYYEYALGGIRSHEETDLTRLEDDNLITSYATGATG